MPPSRKKTTSSRSSAEPPKAKGSKDYVQVAIDYATGVVQGTIRAGKLARLGCQRFLNDLERSRTRGFPYVLNPEKAARACKFNERLPHVKGDWAKRKELIVLEPVQVYVEVNLFGWVHKTTGLRRFRRSYGEMPRKNGKSTLAAGVGLYMGTADGEEGAEVYCGATSEQQAWEVFRPMKQMVERTPKLRAALGLRAYASSIVQEKSGSRIMPVIGKPGDGSSPHCAIIDEYHEHQTDELYDTMETGMGARSQPLMFVITTAGSDLEGPCYRMRQVAVDVLNGVVEDEELFAFIYTLDEDDDWTDEEILWKANPCAGVSVSIDYLRSQQRKAVINASKSGVFRTKNLNQWVTARNPYFNIEAWKKCKRTIDISDFVGALCIAFIDLASTKDLAALILLFLRDDGTYATIPRFWLPEDRVKEVKTTPYEVWAEEEHLTLTPGNVIDYAFIEDELRELRSIVEFKEIAYDPFQATYLATRMTAEGFPMVQCGMTVKNFSEPMKLLDKLILSGRIVHDGNPVMTWNMGNVVAKEDAKENVFPRKERPENKIDGGVALIGALGRWGGQDVDDGSNGFFAAL